MESTTHQREVSLLMSNLEETDHHSDIKLWTPRVHDSDLLAKPPKIPNTRIDSLTSSLRKINGPDRLKKELVISVIDLNQYD